jgi:surface polysaccharide O-acyltransferase-like enzyme
MIYATASAWAQDLKHRLSNVPFNIGPLATLLGLCSYACFTVAGIMLWLDQTRSAFAALASLVIFVIGLIMFGCSILLRASTGQRQAPAAKRSLEMTHHAAE